MQRSRKRPHEEDNENLPSPLPKRPLPDLNSNGPLGIQVKVEPGVNANPINFDLNSTGNVPDTTDFNPYIKQEPDYSNYTGNPRMPQQPMNSQQNQFNPNPYQYNNQYSIGANMPKNPITARSIQHGADPRMNQDHNNMRNQAPHPPPSNGAQSDYNFNVNSNNFNGNQQFDNRGNNNRGNWNNRGNDRGRPNNFRGNSNFGISHGNNYQRNNNQNNHNNYRGGNNNNNFQSNHYNTPNNNNNGNGNFNKNYSQRGGHPQQNNFRGGNQMTSNPQSQQRPPMNNYANNSNPPPAINANPLLNALTRELRSNANDGGPTVNMVAPVPAQPVPAIRKPTKNISSVVATIDVTKDPRIPSNSIQIPSEPETRSEEEEEQPMGRYPKYQDLDNEVETNISELSESFNTPVRNPIKIEVKNHHIEPGRKFDEGRAAVKHEMIQTDPTQLPIARLKEKILETIFKNQVTIISGDTGSGKSTQIPQYIYNESIKRGKKWSIICSQPRRIAATSLATRVASEMDQPVGKVVGFQISMDKQVSQETRILFCTTGILVERLIHQRNALNLYTHIILDEVHERSLEMDFALMLLKKILPKNPRIRLILMSATFDCLLFANYLPLALSERHSSRQYRTLEHLIAKRTEVLDLNEVTQSNQETTNITTPIVEVKGNCFPVTLYYLEDIFVYLTIPPHDHKNYISDLNGRIPSISKHLYELAVDLIIKIDLDNKDLREDESILVFLPGFGEIQYMYKLLTEKGIFLFFHMKKSVANGPDSLHESAVADPTALHHPTRGATQSVLKINRRLPKGRPVNEYRRELHYRARRSLRHRFRAI